MIREHECTGYCDYDGGDFQYSSIELDQVTIILTTCRPERLRARLNGTTAGEREQSS